MAAPTAVEPVSECVGELLSSHGTGYALQSDAAWWHLTPTANRNDRRQGWKVHVSASPLTAVETLRAVAAVVMPRGHRWKVARSVSALVDLCSPPSPLPQSGKFITVYLDEGDPAALAAELHDVTKLFNAPVVPSDRRYCRGSNVYLRYGAFSAQHTYGTAEQTQVWTLTDDLGRQVEDRREPGRFAPSWVPDLPLPPLDVRLAAGPGLFGRGITVLGVLSQSVKGGVYRVRYGGEQAVLKEARFGTCPDLTGRDARSSLYNEWEILRLLKGTGLAPEPIAFFFEEDNAYLVEEFLPGRTLRETVDRLNYRGAIDAATLTGIARNVRELVAAVRARDVIQYDLTPNNIMVDGNRYRVIDLEHAGTSGSPEPRMRGWTPGYSPDETPGRSVESFDLDFPLAALEHFVFTGADPFIARSVPYAQHAAAVLDTFAPAEIDTSATRDGLAAPAIALRTDPDADRVLEEATLAGRELVRLVDWERRPWPWPGRWAPGKTHPVSFMAGTSGIARFFLDLWRASGDQDWLGHAEDLIAWSAAAEPFVVGRTPPGLYFGFGALPWLMADLIQAGRAQDVWQRRALALTAAVATADPASWDITHGWAGIGLAQLAVLRATGDHDCRAAAERTLRRVLDGATSLNGVPSWDKRGHRFHGFAHGDAGVAYYLLHAGRDLGNSAAVELATTVAHGLLTIATPVADGRAISWRHRDGSDTVWSHWCNGAAGVGGFLAALGSATGDEEISAAAVRAGRAITLTRPFGSCCRCHGLAGDGDFLLDVAALPGHREEFHASARYIGRKLEALKFDDGTAPKWGHEGDGEPRPGFMRGYTGIHSFRLRLHGHLNQAPLMLPVDPEGAL
ncbi:lanthionine synthetase LanC family protein [Actinophytocola sp.]|uniref:class III lanthionine synthetase LanKC N-terminal domain-containing protein n=1 Tax=Actinophytocola sp. TaxID=1872138 RepID=UPI003D6A8501